MPIRPRRRQQWHPRQHDSSASCDVKVHDTTRVSEAAGAVFGEIDNRKHINRFHGCRVPSNSISNIIHAMHNLYSIFGSTELSSFTRPAKVNNLELCHRCFDDLEEFRVEKLSVLDHTRFFHPLLMVTSCLS